ncbi:MAG: 2Fe-2S iron-sulfur cluster binding domain-containing protein [Candidatus Eisenbacteria bacterium]|nr:2Fe-2S iron-sulfur cluster binding domain-containing protein [Candidatus Eisenbacteria bacterium]
MKVGLTVNGVERNVDVSSSATLVELLREGLGLTGTKVGCGRGECGACTVLLDGEPVNSCLVFAAQCEGREVLTIEGLGADRRSEAIRKAFIEAGAVQCGFCTPGMIMSTVALLRRKRHPTRDEIAEAISGNLCRCTGYVKIIDAIEKASRGV